MRNSFLILSALLFLYSCSPAQQLTRTAQDGFLNSEPLRTAHVGVSIFDPAENKYLYNYQGDKYFVPASNTKIPTCYAAMKYLGDSLVGLRYLQTDTAVYIQPTADPTLLHRDFPRQPVIQTLKSFDQPIYYVLPNWETTRYGSGWSWNDYSENYMPERSALPIYGNVLQINLYGEGKQLQLRGDIAFYKHSINELVDPLSKQIKIQRLWDTNRFDVTTADRNFTSIQIPFLTYENPRLLEDTIKKNWRGRVVLRENITLQNIYTQPTDSLLKPMMQRSDNFFAEQVLLMVGNALVDIMSDNRIIDTILKTDFKDLPQKPRWADGSGLSRYNLFTPQDFVAILNKMKNEFGMERIQAIFPTGNTGTLTNYYKSLNGKLFAKTGTLSGVVALSGFMYTKKNKLLIFSVLVNNHQSTSTNVRRAVEQFLTGVQEKY
jgi:D-alanyl-D-alanine carboxypeptidase/D-alanyl-D-alanine-endopeptidase (penicillin-binding protein 4)